MTSSFVDNGVNTGPIQGVPTSTMLVWTQVGEIVFPVYTTVPISAGPSMTGNENAVAITPDDPLSKVPSAAKPCPSDKNCELTRITSETKNHDFSSCKVFLRAMKTTLPKVQQSGTSLKDTNKEQGAMLTSDRFVGVIDIDPHEPSVLHLLENYGLSSSSTPRDVFAIGRTSTFAHANAEAENQTVTPAQLLGTVNAILREAPYDPVLNDDLTRWTERLRESVANLSKRSRKLLQSTTGTTDSWRHPRRTHDHRQPTAPSARCRAFNRSLRDVRWPERFQPGAIEKYDGSTDPEEFLQVYSTVLYAAGADDNALANYLPMALKGSTRSWLMHLPPYSISSWADLWQQFIANFQGTYKRHAIEDDLHALTQNPGESLRDYVRRFNECRNTIPDITNVSVIHAFKTGVRDCYTTQELATRRITTTRRLFEVVDRCAHADDALRRKNDKPKAGGDKKPAKDTPKPSKKKSGKSGKRKAQAEVLASEYERPPKHPDPQGSDTKRIWCPIHKSDIHSLEECLIFKKSLEKQLALEKGKRVRVVEKATEETTQDSDLAYLDSYLHVSHIFGGSTAYSLKREYKKVECEVCSTLQGVAPKMKWSEQKIEFLDEDHPKAAVIPGRYPIVVEPTIRNIKVV
uniref:Transposon protein, putative, unclassified n=2 Tax=Oryza sativa subsp. japonica TaxID=39947 RepID=Q2R588_ORYSJ|nr:transposon protein, putative, unclassified [Oryza sativa Japonica Group]ABA93300.1 transposon protein, putative, unclassified [Oryza sativa Japonica Group]